jgi:DNA invertase Pin-like site-specific DNA recombinase
VAHSDRLARGDGKRAMHVVEYVLWAMKANVRLRSVADDHALRDVLHGALIGERNFEDSKAKSAHVKRGKRARVERGESTGPLHFAYRLEPELDDAGRPKASRDGRIAYRRMPDPERRAVYVRMVELAEAGRTFGEIARDLNASGHHTKRGKTWSTRQVRMVMRDPYYSGYTVGYGETRKGNHEPLIERERWEALQAKLDRQTPVAARGRKGGRPGDGAYILRGVLTCGGCGASMYTREYAAGRYYLCASVREARGTCDLPRVAADLVETPTVSHLTDGFGLHLRERIERRVAEHEAVGAEVEAALGRERRELRKRERSLERARENAADLLDRRHDHADRVLDALERHEGRVAEQAERVQHIAGELVRHDRAVSMDEVLDRYNQIRGLVEGRLSEAKDAAALNSTLRDLLAYATVDVDDRGRIAVQFRLAHDPATFSEGEDFEVATIAAPEWIRDRRYGPSLRSTGPGKPDSSPWCRSSPSARRSRGTSNPRPSAAALVSPEA